MTKIRYLDEEWAGGRNITHQDIDHVLRSDVWEDVGPSNRGNDRLMFVGFDPMARLLEVGVEYLDEEGVELVFHADVATPYYQRLFERLKP